MPIICAQFCFLKLTIQISFLISGRCCFLSRKEAGFPENDNSKELIWILAPPPFSFQSPCHNLAFSQHYQSKIVFSVQIWGWGLHILEPLPYGVFFSVLFVFAFVQYQLRCSNNQVPFDVLLCYLCLVLGDNLLCLPNFGVLCSLAIGQ